MKVFKILASLALLFVIVLAISNSCGGGKSEKSAITDYAPYKVFKIEPIETSQKALVAYYANLTVEKTSKDSIEATMEKLYEEASEYSIFANYDAPTMVYVYLYDKNTQTDTIGNWIAMLRKTPDMIKPEIQYMDMYLEKVISSPQKK